MTKFVGERITVTTQGEIPAPVTFRWNKSVFTVAEIIVSWFDWGFPAGAMQRDWKTRRHRRYYRVRTDSGDIFEIYFDRKTPSGTGEWYLYQKLDGDESSAA
ncbi:MAG TPA: DUF6504 family protein [candidate division Zixibacteria bacterium]|jgi:hypothetical protein